MTVMRIGSSKVKTGCSTCKSRHLKCDETRPVCVRCTRSGFKCGYEAASKPKAPARFVHYIPDVHSSVSPSPRKSTEEFRGLEYFHLQTATTLLYPFSAEMWTKHLLRLASHERAIGYALSAFGLAHYNFACGETSLPGPALKLYNESIKLVVQQWRDDASSAPEVALASSVIFACLELLRGCFRSAIRIVASANRLLTEVDAGTKQCDEAKLPRDQVRWYLIQMSIQVIDVGGFVDDGEDYHHHSVLLRPTQTRMTNGEEAMMWLAVIYNQVLHVYDCIEDVGPRADLHPHWDNMVSEVQQLRGEYRRWLGGFRSLKAANPPDRSSAETTAAIVLVELLSHIVSIMVDLDLLSPEDDFDRHISAFRAIVDSAELALNGESGAQRGARVFSLVTTYVGPLYFVAARCRNSDIRHRALRLLQSCERREGMWDSAVVAAIAENIIKLEEGSWNRSPVLGRTMPRRDIENTEGDCYDVQDRVKLVTISWNEEAGGKAAFSREYAGSSRSGDRLGGLEFRELASW